MAFLAAIPVILFFSIGASYLNRKISLAKDAPIPPKALEAGLDASIPDWKYTQEHRHPSRVSDYCQELPQIKDPSTGAGLELRLYHKEGAEYDLVRSSKAEFDRSTNKLYSEGDVDITMECSWMGRGMGVLLKIHTSGAASKA